MVQWDERKRMKSAIEYEPTGRRLSAWLTWPKKRWINVVCQDLEWLEVTVWEAMIHDHNYWRSVTVVAKSHADLWRHTRRIMVQLSEYLLDLKWCEFFLIVCPLCLYTRKVPVEGL